MYSVYYVSKCYVGVLCKCCVSECYVGVLCVLCCVDE